MAKLELQQGDPLRTSTEPTVAPTESSKLSTVSAPDSSARHQFTDAQNPFADRRKKRKDELDLDEEKFTAIRNVEQLIKQEAPEATPEAPSGLSVSKASVLNEQISAARKLEGRAAAGDLVMNSNSGRPQQEEDSVLARAREKEEALARAREEARQETARQAEQQRAQARSAQLEEQRQQEKVLEDVRIKAESIAKAHFAESPNRIISQEEFKTYLEQIISKTNADATLVAKVQEEFIKTYQAQHEKQFQEMNWVKRKYYEAAKWCSGALDSLKEVGDSLVAIGKGAVETVQAVAKGAKALAVGIKDVVVNTDWKALGEKAFDLVTDPENWKKAASTCWSLTKKACSAVGEAAWNVVTDPIGSIKATGKFLGEMSDSLGLTAAAKGLVTAIKTPYQYAYDLVRPGGGFAVANENLKSNIKEVKDGLLGAGQCFCEVTGLADAYNAVKHGGKALILLGEGRKLEAALEGAQAVMYAGFAVASAGSIAATVASGGAAVGTVAAVATGRIAAKEALKQLAKHGTKEIAKELAESVLEHGVKNGVKTIASEVAQQSAERLGKETVELVIKEGASKAVTKEVAEKVTKEIAGRASELGEKAAQEILDKSGITKHLTECAETAFRDLQKGGKELQEKLMDAGLSSKEAKKIATETSNSFRRGATDKEVLEILTKETAERLQKEIVPEASERFGKVYRTQLDDALQNNPAFKESMDRIAHAAGKSTKEFTDDLASAASKAYREGLEKGIKEAVEKAIKKALLKFRPAKGIGGSAMSDISADFHELNIEVEYAEELYVQLKREEEVKPQHENKNEVDFDKRSRIVERDGNLIRVQFYMVEGNEIITSQDIVGSLEKIEAPKNVIKHDFVGNRDDKSQAA